MALDPIFGLHTQALSLQQRRMDVLAGNIANSDTPNFQARDIDFAATLRQAAGLADGAAGAPSTTLATASSGTSITSSSPGDQSSFGADGLANGLVWRVPTQNSADGNTVDTQIEQAKFADAALHYQASLNFIDGKVKNLLTAITGQ